MTATTPKPNQSTDAMVIDAIDHIAQCIADTINDLIEPERDKQRIELVNTFAAGLLSKAKAAGNRHKQAAKESLSLYIAYVKPPKEDRKPAMPAAEPEVVSEIKPVSLPEEGSSNRFQELKAKSEE